MCAFVNVGYLNKREQLVYIVLGKSQAEISFALNHTEVKQMLSS